MSYSTTTYHNVLLRTVLYTLQTFYPQAYIAYSSYQIIMLIHTKISVHICTFCRFLLYWLFYYMQQACIYEKVPKSSRQKSTHRSHVPKVVIHELHHLITSILMETSHTNFSQLRPPSYLTFPSQKTKNKKPILLGLELA